MTNRNAAWNAGAGNIRWPDPGVTMKGGRSFAHIFIPPSNMTRAWCSVCPSIARPDGVKLKSTYIMELGPDTEENTRRQLLEFRNVLASVHGALSYLDGSGSRITLLFTAILPWQIPQVDSFAESIPRCSCLRTPAVTPI